MKARQLCKMKLGKGRGGYDGKTMVYLKRDVDEKFKDLDLVIRQLRKGLIRLQGVTKDE